MNDEGATQNEELKEQWIKSNAELERVQKNLADYLETKRAAFARFYFLSNDELISILSQTKDPNAVQPHLRKCFEAVQSVTMQGSECEMSEMISAEAEKVPFMTKLYPKGSVEIWMGEIETMMRRSVRAITEVIACAWEALRLSAWSLPSSKPKTNAWKGARIRLSIPKALFSIKATGHTSSRILSTSPVSMKSSWSLTTREDRCMVSAKPRKRIQMEAKPRHLAEATWKEARRATRELKDETKLPAATKRTEDASRASRRPR